MDDRYADMNREELLKELRGVLFRYEQFRNNTLPKLNAISAERDDLRRQVARLEGRIDQVAMELETLATLDDDDFAGMAAAGVLAEIRRRAQAAHDRVVL